MALDQSNYYKQIAASAARTASANFADQHSPYHRGVTVVVDITAVADTPSVTFKVQGKDPLSGNYFDLLASTAQTGTGTIRLTVYPGITATANVSASVPLPSEWRVTATAADADSMTYSVSALMHI